MREENKREKRRTFTLWMPQFMKPGHPLHFPVNEPISAHSGLSQFELGFVTHIGCVLTKAPCHCIFVSVNLAKEPKAKLKGLACRVLSHH